MKLDNIYRLAKIITQDIEGDISTEDKEKLEKWLNESKENIALLEEFKKEIFLSKKQNESARFNKHMAYSKFVARKRQKERSLRIRRIVINFVAVLLPVFIVVSFFYIDKTPPRQSNTVSKSIPPGSSKAVLTLADGKKIEIDGKVNDTIVDSRGTVLTALGSRVEYEANTVGNEIIYHNLDIPRSGEFFVKLSDGTKVWINSQSRLRYPVTFAKNERKVFLEGEAYFEVTKDKARPFIVESNGSKVKVLGTSFNIRSYSEDKRVVTTLVNGRVRLSNGRREENKMLLEKGEQGVVDVINGTINKKNVDVEKFIAWKEGRFVFREQCLEEIMITMSRWYDINVFFVNECAKNVSFSGNLKRYDDFVKIIDMLEMTGMVKFEVKGKTIYIRKK